MQIIHIFLLFIISQFSDPCNRLSWLGLRVSFLANVRPKLTYCNKLKATPLQLEVLQYLALAYVASRPSSAKTYSREQIM